MEVAINAAALLGECPRWDAATGRLLWVDIEARTLHLFDPASGDDRSILFDDRVGAAAPTTDGGVLVALADRLVMVDLGDESVRTLVEIPHGDGLRLNDGACDPSGRLWVGSLALDYARGRGALYRYSIEEGLERVLEDVTLSNGIGWSPDGGTMYYVDSMAYRVDAFDFDVATGAISERRPLIVIERGAGIPDGLAVDDEGGIWLALWGRAAIRCYRPDGEVERVLAVPADNVTACCFGGDDGRSLYVTSASVELPVERRSAQPLAGSVFVTDPGVSGPPAQPFFAG
jgi:sugar lactone lactonase YvrE